MRTMSARDTETETDLVHPSHLADSILPTNWEWMSLGSICRTTSGGTPSRKNKEYFEGNIPWVKSGELPDGPISEIEEYITAEAVKNSSAKQFPKGTLLIALYGATVGKLGVLNKAAATNQAVCAIFPPEQLETKYLFWYLRFVRSDLIAQAIGGAQPNISQGILRNLLIPVAPPDEQKLIVAEIEKQFSRLDEAVANLKRIKANLKRYKAAVLKAAVEGKLTEDWRKANPDVEPASKLLARILTDRRAKWKGKGKYKEAHQPDTSTDRSLPKFWIWASVDQLSNLVTDGDHNPPKRVPAGVPHLTAKHIKGWRISFEGCSYISLSDYERTRSRFEPKPGDIIVTCVGTVGQTAIVPAEITFSADRNLAGIRLVERGILPKFLQIVLNAPAWQLRMTKASGSTAQPHLYLGDLRALPIPLPPFIEQQFVIAEVERRLSGIDKLEAAVEANLTRADRLRQSILHQAFSGQLPCPQRPMATASLEASLGTKLVV